MIFLCVLLGIALAISLFINLNLFRQNEQLTKVVENLNITEYKIYTEAVNYYQAFLFMFTDAYSELQRIDKRGSFSSDDEVGFAFKVIVTAIKNVKEKIQELKDEFENDESQEKTN
jgi:hypothetical protein